MAALKLLPIIQQIYACMARIRGSYNVLEVVHDELTSNTSKGFRTDNTEAEAQKTVMWRKYCSKKFKGSFLNDLGFKYV